MSDGASFAPTFPERFNMARYFLDDRIDEGRGDEIRRCHFTNYCEALDQRHKQVTCKLWDHDALDAPDVKLDESGRRRLVAPRWTPEPR